MQRRRFLRATALGALSAGAALRVRAQAYPGPAKVVLPLQAASASDVAVRLMVERLAPRLGTSMVVENVAAAAGLVGLEQLSRTRADGRTVAALNNSIVTILPHLQPGKIKGEPRRDYLPVAGIANIPTFFAVPASSPVKTVQDLIKLAKAQPEKLTYSSGGVGSPQHLATEMFKSFSGTSLLHASLAESGAEPPMVILYREPILLEWIEDGHDLYRLVRNVLVHEIAHHFGFSDAEIAALEAEG